MAALRTLNDLDSTNMPSAQGYSTQESKFSAMTIASRALAKLDAPSAIRRPCCSLSSAGPISGAMTANGATVISRYSSTLLVDSAVAAAKNKVFANATASAASTA